MEKKSNIAIILNALTVCLGLACTIISLINSPWEYRGIVVDIVIYVLICCYAFYWYKKPHGNLLRYLMFAFGLTLIYQLYISSVVIFDLKCLILYPVTIALISYMSGRLNKIRQNRFIAVVILLLLCHCSHAQVNAVLQIVDSRSLVNRITDYSPAFIWLALSSAYFTRFLQHKEAGLLDKQ